MEPSFIFTTYFIFNPPTHCFLKDIDLLSNHLERGPRIYTSIISILVINYFIKEQLEFSEIKKGKLKFLVIFSLYQFLDKFNINGNKDIMFLIVIVVIALLIGWYQTTDYQVQTRMVPAKNNDEKATTSQQEHPMHKVIFAKCGMSYLIGWVIIFILTVFLNSNFHAVSLSAFFNDLFAEIINDLLIFERVSDDSGSWATWGLMLFSNLAYLITLKKKYPNIKFLI